MKYLVCLIKTVYYTVVLTSWPFGPWMDAHSYVEQEDGSLKCRYCKHISK